MSFIVVKYGANEEKLFNPNCLSSVFLTHIKRSCGFEDMPENVDLATESGEVIDLLSKQKEYAKKHLEPRAAYILLKVNDEQSEDLQLAYVPLVDQSISEKIKLVSSGKRGDASKGKRHMENLDASSNNASNASTKTKNEPVTMNKPVKGKPLKK